MKELFTHADYDSGLNRVIMAYFDIMYNDGHFLRTLDLFTQRSAYNTDGAYCSFPDLDSYDEGDHFEGIWFGFGYPLLEKDTVIVSEKEGYDYVRMASERYLKKHPEYTKKVTELLKKMPA